MQWQKAASAIACDEPYARLKRNGVSMGNGFLTQALKP
jgi:hypothetical protein